MDDWRRATHTDIMSTPLDMTTLISRLHRSPGDQHHDVSFRLPDGSEVGGHKLVLAVASPVFESQFYGPMAAENTDVVTVREVGGQQGLQTAAGVHLQLWPGGVLGPDR